MGIHIPFTPRSFHRRADRGNQKSEKNNEAHLFYLIGFTQFYQTTSERNAPLEEASSQKYFDTMIILHFGNKINMSAHPSFIRYMLRSGNHTTFYVRNFVIDYL